MHRALQPGHGSHNARQVGLLRVHLEVRVSVLLLLVTVERLLLVVHDHLKLGILLVSPHRATQAENEVIILRPEVSGAQPQCKKSALRPRTVHITYITYFTKIY